MPARDLPWRVEETCWNAFPSLKQVLAGDFLLRFAGGVSRRANSVNPLRAEPGDIPAAIGAAEQLYRVQKQATIFRVPTMVDPALDSELARRGYMREGETCVLHGPIGRIAAAADPEVQLLAAPEPDWLAAMSFLQGHTAEQRQHLASCPVCADLVQDLKYIAEQAKLLVPMEDPSPRVWEGIERSLKQDGLWPAHGGPANPRPFLVPQRSRLAWPLSIRAE